jgi:hypothetical protein
MITADDCGSLSIPPGTTPAFLSARMRAGMAIEDMLLLVGRCGLMLAAYALARWIALSV